MSQFGLTVREGVLWGGENNVRIIIKKFVIAMADDPPSRSWGSSGD